MSPSELAENRPIALITGGASGIGLATAEALAHDNWIVALADRDPSVVDIAEKLGGTGTQVDVKDTGAVDAWVNSQPEATALVTCAGVIASDLLVESSDEQWTSIMDVNFHGTVRALRAFARNRMAAGGGGSAVLISSLSADWPAATAGAYCASKAAMVQMARCVAIELGPHGIRVNSVAPGNTMTAMTKQAWIDDPDDLVENIKRTPLGRIGQPSDIAGAVRMLLSPDAAWITGQLIKADGGLSLLGEPGGNVAQQEL